MWIQPKPAFTTTSTAATLVPRATSEANAPAHSCPPAYPSCNPEVGPGPALIPVANADSSSAHSSEASAGSTTPGMLTPTPQAALATSIQHFGKQNFVGLLVLGLLAFAGLVLWLTFGAWPQRTMRRLRARIANKGDAAKGGRDGDSEGRRGADLDRDQGQDAACAPREREPSDEDDKDQPGSEEGPPGSSESLEMVVQGLDKGTGEEAGRTLPRVRFA